MSSQAVEDRSRLRHQAGLFDSDEALLSMLVPFIERGVAADEPVVVVLSGANAALVRSVLPDAGSVTFIPADEQYVRPASTIQSYRRILEDRIADGAAHARLVGEVPHPGTGADWGWWGRYEAAFNHAFASFPVSVVCPYDTRITPSSVLDQVRRTHPYLSSGTHRGRSNPRFEDPARFIGSLPHPPRDQVQDRHPDVELREPTPAAARHAVEDLAAARFGLDEEKLDGLLVAVSEAVTNGLVHGRPSVVLRAWLAPDRLVVAVQDAGRGVRHPFAGLVPLDPRGSGGGLGLWLASQLCDEMAFDSNGQGFTVRLRVSLPTPG